MPHFMIVLIPYTNSLNLSWIKKCLCLRNMESKKCKCLQRKVKCVGHIVSEEADAENSEKVVDWTIPTNAKVGQFTSFSGYYRVCIKIIYSSYAAARVGNTFNKSQNGLPLETKNTQNHENRRLGLTESLHSQHWSLRGKSGCWFIV